MRWAMYKNHKENLVTQYQKASKGLKKHQKERKEEGWGKEGGREKKKFQYQKVDTRYSNTRKWYSHSERLTRNLVRELSACQNLFIYVGNALQV